MPNKTRVNLVFDSVVWEVFKSFCKQKKIPYSVGVEESMRLFLKTTDFEITPYQKLSEVEYKTFLEDLQKVLTIVKKPSTKKQK
jgi:hypothetical protein